MKVTDVRVSSLNGYCLRFHRICVLSVCKVTVASYHFSLKNMHFSAKKGHLLNLSLYVSIVYLDFDGMIACVIIG